MEDIVLDLEKREVTGKAVRRLRDQGLVPAVIHDHGKPSIHVMGRYVDVVKVYGKAGKHHPVNLKAGPQTYTALIRGVDIDPKKHTIRHVVFNAVKADEKVDTEVPVRIRFDEGNEASPAERAGLVVLTQLEAVEVEALPRDLPDVLEFDGEKLIEVGDHATVADLIVPSTVTVKTDSSHPLATVFEPSALAAANDAAAGTATTEDGEEAPEGGVEAAAEGEAPAGEAPAEGESAEAKPDDDSKDKKE